MTSNDTKRDVFETLTTEQQSQIDQDLIADIAELSERESKQKAAY